MRVEEPMDFEQAKDNKEWMNAMKEDYDSTMKNETWELMELPENEIPIG
jgi:hypothetical protein